MMRPIVLNVMVLAPAAPTQTTAATFTGNVNVTWTDPTPATMGDMQNEVGFIIERCARINNQACTNFVQIGKALANATSYTDTTATTNPYYSYRVIAYNAAGNSPASNVISTTTSAAINGVCGASDGGIFTAAPTTNLCDAGTSSTVTYAAPTWSWTCSGINPLSGATDASCSANIQNYVLTFNAGANGTISSGSTVQVVNHGSNAATVTAAPNTAFSFVSWTDMSGAIVSLLPGYRAMNVTSSRQYTANFAMRGDFNGDGNVDILWTDTITNNSFVWFMNNMTKLAEVQLPTAPGAGWAIVGKGDFNNDGRPDIIWRNQSLGQNVLWYMNGSVILGAPVNLPSISTAWTFGGVGDFNGDGKTDILWRNAATSAVNVWYMDGPTRLSNGIGPTISSSWVIGGVGDFDKDGVPDIVWRNPTTGAMNLWYMNANFTRRSNGIGPTIAAPWVIGGVGDFDKDGIPDVLWRNPTTGANNVWYMNTNFTRRANGAGPVKAGSNWVIVGK